MITQQCKFQLDIDNPNNENYKQPNNFNQPMNQKISFKDRILKLIVPQEIKNATKISSFFQNFQ